MSHRLNEALKSLRSGDLTAAAEGMVEVLDFVISVDQALSSSMHLQISVLVNILLKKRQSYVNMVSPLLHVADKARLLFCPVSFDHLFDKEVVDEFVSESKSMAVIDAAKCPLYSAASRPV